MPCRSGHTPQQMEALLVLVTDDVVSERAGRPGLALSGERGHRLCSDTVRQPSIISMTMRCGLR